MNQPNERRFLIDLNLLREGYELSDIDEVFWMPGHENPADGLTKCPTCSDLQSLIRENFTDFNPNSWSERPTPKWA